MYKAKNYLYILCIFFASCTNKQVATGEIEVLSFSMDNVTTHAMLSELSESASLVVLETNDNALISEVRKVVSTKESLYVSDGTTLFKFDTDGRFIDKLNKQGAGPEEYLSISDFQVDASGNIWILSRNKLLKYTDKNLFAQKIDLPYGASQIKLLDEDRMMLYLGNAVSEDNSDQIKLFSLSKEEVIDGYLDIDAAKANYLFVMSTNHFSLAKEANELYVFQTFNDTVYKYSPSGFHPQYVMDMGGKNIPRSFFDKNYDNIMEFFQELFKHTYAYGVGAFIEKDNYYFYSFYYDKQPYLACIPKRKEQQSQVFGGIKDDINLCGYPLNLSESEIFVQEDNQLLIPIMPFDVMEYAEEHMTETQLAKVKSALKYSTEDQNPVLLYVTLKR